MRSSFDTCYQKYLHTSMVLFAILCFLSVTGCDLTAIAVSPSTSEIEIEMGEVVSFEGEGIGGTPFSEENGEPLYGYFWQTGGLPQTSGEKTVDVTYPYPGVYTVSFTVRDKAGDRDTEYIQVTVLGEDLESTILSPGISHIEVKAGETVSFAGEAFGGIPFLDQDNEPYYGYFWQTSGGDPSSSADKSVDVMYETEGTYDVSFTVTDKAGKTNTKNIYITVNPAEQEVEEDAEDEEDI
jgi:PKD repeat protein